MRTFSTLIGAVAAMLIMLSAGCSSGPTVRVDKDPSANLRAYKTFAFFEPIERSGPQSFLESAGRGGPPPLFDPAGRGGLPALPDPAARDDPRYTTLPTQHLQRAVREQMERQGYVYDDAHPDLRVNAVLHVDEKFELYTTPGAFGYVGLGGGVNSFYYRQGTLSVDLVDARRKALVWQGVAEGRVNTQVGKDPRPAIEAAVAEMFAAFPNGKEK